MPVIWTPSADKHDVPHEEAMYAIQNAEVTAEIDGLPGEVTTVYIGHPHAQTERYLEVIAALRRPRELRVFHVMPLTDVFRYLLFEEDEQ